MVKISIIVPVFNCGNSIKKCINSILNQSFSDFELIIINDGSSDNSEEIIKGFQDKRITYIRTTNMGVSHARNIGIEISKGDFIIFIDGDDYIESNMLDVLIKNSFKHKSDFIIFGYYSETIDGSYYKISKSFKKYNSLGSFSIDIIFLYENSLFNNINKLYKREIIIRNNLRFNNNISFGEDNIFNQNYIMFCSSFLVISDCLYHYVREQKNSVTSNYIDNLFNIRVNENKLYIDFFDKLKIRNYNNFLCKWFIERSIGCLENIHRSDLKFSFKYKLTKDIVNNNVTKNYLKSYKTNNLFIKIILFCYRFTFISYLIGWGLHFFKKHFPNKFNNLKNKR